MVRKNCFRFSFFFLLSSFIFFLPPAGCSCSCNGEHLRSMDECEIEAISGEYESCSTPDNPLLGECKAGRYACIDGKKDRAVCVEQVLPAPEICDGKDNDCDDAVDDVTPNDDPRLGVKCGQEFMSKAQIGVGVCKLGTTACQAGAVICSGITKPEREKCDNRDNDCNGLTDDGDFGTCRSPDNTRLIGLCRPGVNKCERGTMFCDGEVKPAPEICDGKDNDCDGEPDEDCAVKLICPPDTTTAVNMPVTLTVSVQTTNDPLADLLWSLIAWPAGGNGTPNQWTPDPPMSFTETFLPKIVGVYIIRITATMQSGFTTQCETRVSVTDYGLRIELTWNGDGDIDLHLHDDTPTPWFNLGGDHVCFYANSMPDWEIIGLRSDDPWLDVDNTVRDGPENIRIQLPAIGKTYTIGVHNYAGGENRIAKIEIFCGSSQTAQATYTSRAFRGFAVGQCTINDFWKVASVTVLTTGACVINRIDDWSESNNRCQSF